MSPVSNMGRWGLDGNRFRFSAAVILFVVSFLPYYSIDWGFFFGTVYWSAWSGFLPFVSLVMTGAAGILAIVLVASHCEQRLWHYIVYIVLYSVSLLSVAASAIILTDPELTRDASPYMHFGIGFFVYVAVATAGVIVSGRQLRAYWRMRAWIAAHNMATT